MSSVFSRIIDGDIPGRFAYADETCVVFATIEPIAPGHMLVVPREEYGSFVDTPDDVLGHMMAVAKRVGLAQQAAYPGTRAVMMIAGFDVPHLHFHVCPVERQSAMTFAHAHAASAEALDAACQAVREALCQLGFAEFVPAEMSKL